ncbi:MAG: phosphopantetheine-binding protein, partial [Pseudomonadota bacterium]|nr:phosphopantetheine-binding protein [Pseudomonadota bacterium]
THLKHRLPEYMMPSAYVTLDHLPLTPTGKLDRRSLPEPESELHGTSDYAAPRGGMEELVAKVWREILETERIDRRDNFFDIGGHSLLATRVLAHINELLDVDLPLRILFERPTIESLSERLTRDLGIDASVEAS